MRAELPRALLTLACAMLAQAQTYQWELPRGFPKPRVPVDNPMSVEKAELGRRLFYDTRLSGNGKQSCASCHRQELAFTDGRAAAVGSTGQTHPRSAMSLVNIAYSPVLTWSNPLQRSLERQARVPLFGAHPVELGLQGNAASTLAAFREDGVYRKLFPRAFPGENAPFTIANVTKALAAFERTIISARSPYDRYYRGGDRAAISESAQRGEALFFTDGVAGCFRCHGGFNLSDATAAEGVEPAPVMFHNTALYGEPYPKLSLGIFTVTGRRRDIGKFKTPTVRNVGLTAPYMHDGSIATLEEVIEHYEAGGRAHGNPNKDRRMTKIYLTPQNRKDLLAFLHSLTDLELTRDVRFSNPWGESEAP